MAASPSTVGELVAAAEPRISGRLEAGGRSVPAAFACATRLSLEVHLEPGEAIADGAAVDAVVVSLPGGEVTLGRSCPLIPPPRAPVRLVFTEGLFDCRVLVHEARVADLRGWFDNLALVLGQKEHVRPEFRNHVASVAYDLSVYKRFFDEQDRVLAGEPHEVALAARGALIRTEGKKFLAYLDGRIDELGHLVRHFAKEEHERHGFYLRRHLWPYLLSSEFLKRTNLKPSGYAGDAELMVMIYENALLGTSTFNQLMHKHPVETRAAEAVRSRRGLVPRVLREVEARLGGASRFRFLSLACGPAFELEDVFRTRDDLDRFDCTLLDQDPHALELARGVVRRIEGQRGGVVTARYFQDSVRTMLRTRDLRARFGEFQFIYSMGLFDYLTAPVARAVLTRTYELLAPGATIVIGNYHVASPTRIHMDYWADWPLTYRTEESFLALAEGLPVASSCLEFDDTRCQMFLVLEKPT
jgi:extracellular factor (EF) 3-hydroxypalmitic acid methyl ester biosynthesis protein